MENIRVVDDTNDKIVLKDGIMSGTAKTPQEYDKDAGECNLYRDICNMFSERGHPNPENWNTNNRIDEEKLSKAPMSYQRTIINRQLRLKCEDMDHDTRNERLCLVDDGSYEEWKSLARTMVNHITVVEHPELKREEDKDTGYFDQPDNDE